MKKYQASSKEIGWKKSKYFDINAIVFLTFYQDIKAVDLKHEIELLNNKKQRIYIIKKEHTKCKKIVNIFKREPLFLTRDNKMLIF